MTTILIMGVVANLIVVAYLRAERANRLAIRGVERVLIVNKTLNHLRRTIRRAKGVVASHGRWHSDENTLILRTAEGKTLVFTRQDEALAELDTDRPGGMPLLRGLHAEAIRFDYGGRRPAEARLVAVTVTMKPVYRDPEDRLVVRTSAALRTEGGPP